MEYKVLITTSGIGSRLGELTKEKNKALIEINARPALAYIMDSYPTHVPLVFTLGYLSQQVVDFLTTHYAQRSMEFVTVDTYEGLGSSWGYSVLAAEKALQCPFIFHACDTILVDAIPEPATNWIAGFRSNVEELGELAVHYRTQSVAGNRVIRVNERGVKDFNSIHIGLTGVSFYKEFWKALREIYTKNPADSTISDVHVVDLMMKWGILFEWIPFDTWLDTGNISALKKAGEYLRNKSN